MKKAKIEIGQRVKVGPLVGVRPEDINCDTGEIIAVNIRFVRSPELRRIEYTVQFDEPFLKPEAIIYQQIYKLTLDEKKLTPIKEKR